MNPDLKVGDYLLERPEDAEEWGVLSQVQKVDGKNITVKTIYLFKNHKKGNNYDYDGRIKSKTKIEYNKEGTWIYKQIPHDAAMAVLL